MTLRTSSTGDFHPISILKVTRSSSNPMAIQRITMQTLSMIILCALHTYLEAKNGCIQLQSIWHCIGESADRVNFRFFTEIRIFRRNSEFSDFSFAQLESIYF